MKVSSMARGRKARGRDDIDAEHVPEPKRRKTPAGHAEDLHEVAQENSNVAAGGQNAIASGHQALDNRRQAWAAAARRRAAHFAHFASAEDDRASDGDGLHTGGNEARTLGPWSSARQLVEGRARAAAAREDKIVASALAAAEVCDVAEWEPKRNPALGPRATQRVPKLSAMCLALLVEHIHDVETLWGMPSVIKVHLATAVASARRMTPEAALLFTDGTPDDVVLSECTQLDPAALSAALSLCASPRLERLELCFCGRGFGGGPPAALAERGPLSGLKRLRLAGAYRLQDAELAALLAAAPNLQQLALPQCSRLQDVAFLPSYAPCLQLLDLADCRGISAALLCATLPALPALQELHLDGNPEVGDELLADIARARLPLRALSIASCQGITDVGLGLLAAAAPGLRRLCADDCVRLTDATLHALAGSCRLMQEVSLRRCAKLTDDGLAELALGGTLRSLCVAGVPRMGSAGLRALAAACRFRLSRRDSLEDLDVSWCRGVSGAWLGVLTDACANLRRLTLFGCTQVTDEFLYGHARVDLMVQGDSTQKCSPDACAKAVLMLPET